MPRQLTRRALDPDPLQPGAVGRPQVADPHAAGAHLELGMHA